MLARNQFVRSHGLGNDYIVMDPASLSFKLTPENIIRVCNRNTGVGSDGILALEKTSTYEAKLRIYNPDGSEAEKSGNGLRIFCKFLFEHGYTTKTFFEVETAGGVVQAQLHLVIGKAVSVTVDMGKASFDAAKIPVRGAVGDVVDFPLLMLDSPSKAVDPDIQRELKVTCVTVGNPHCVVFFDTLDEADKLIHKLGPLLENHPAFPNRSNVQFVKVINDKEIAIRIWERGAGYTLASGSSSCAAVSACVKTKRTGRDLTVHMPGGDLSIKVSEAFDLTMKGPVEEICVGTVTGELLATLEKNSK